jgi:nitrite reductase/ring-hydroxylating ferredoxin subunit
MRNFVLAGASVSLFGLAACGSSATSTQTIPSVSFSTQINVTNQQYQALRIVNGVVVLPAGGIAGGGVKGLFVVRVDANTYRAYDRNCPYQPYDACSLVSLDRSRLFFRDSCCNSQFDLQGQVTGGPANRQLRSYATSLNGSLLTISN